MAGSKRGEGFDGAAAVTRSLLGYGMLAGAFYLVVGVVLGTTRAGFSFAEHPLSVLMLGDHGWMQRANIIVAGVCFIFLNSLAALTFIRGTLLIPFLMFLVFIGSFTANNDILDWLVDACQSSYIRRFTAPMRVYVMRYRSLSMQFAHRQVTAQDAHEEILELIRRRDESASDYIYRHVILAGAWAIQNLKPDPSGDTPSIAYLRTAWLEHNAAEQ
jgi:signal transduction histidine kinase